MKKLLAFALSLLCVFSLFSCGVTVKMKFEDGELSGGGASYRYAPTGYEPTYQGEEYAVIKGKLEEKLYKIGNLDPKKWLTTEYCGEATLVYYSTDITLPTLAGMNPVNCFICEEGSGAFSVYSLGVENSSVNGSESSVEHEREIIASLVSALSENDEDQIWPRADVNEKYSLKFYSPDWEAIYYNVTYAVCGNEKILHDSVTGNTAVIGDILDEFIENTYDEHNS